ncbi:MAG: 50S ribosomal protein L28 [Deltaproteobacteria bacterium]|nr:50S ribosomal protein L28 [Deltaproteobacteria bacterium]
MPSFCAVCHKGTVFGHNVSHANNKTRKISRPNLQRLHTVTNGRRRRVVVCTRCIRSGFAPKATPVTRGSAQPK